MNLSKKFSDIKIYNGYIDYFKYRKLLKTINIMPILHDQGQVNTVGSGLFFSCITHEIPMIIPKKSSQLQKQLIPGCFRTAVSVDDYVREINHISKNYKYQYHFSEQWNKLISLDKVRVGKILEMFQYSVIAYILVVIFTTILNKTIFSISKEEIESYNTLQLLTNTFFELFLIIIIMYYIQKIILLFPSLPAICIP